MLDLRDLRCALPAMRVGGGRLLGLREVKQSARCACCGQGGGAHDGGLDLRRITQSACAVHTAQKAEGLMTVAQLNSRIQGDLPFPPPCTSPPSVSNMPASPAECTPMHQVWLLRRPHASSLGGCLACLPARMHPHAHDPSIISSTGNLIQSAHKLRALTRAVFVENQNQMEGQAGDKALQPAIRLNGNTQVSGRGITIKQMMRSGWHM